MDRLRVAIIGAGGMARRHLEVLRSIPEAEVVAVSSRGLERLEKLASDFEIDHRFRSNEEMLKTVRPDAVLVTVNAVNLYEVTLLCIEHGISALLEKPPGLTASQTESLLGASKRVEGQYMVGLNRRFYSVIQGAKKIVDDSGGLVSVLIQTTEDVAAIRTSGLHPAEVLEHWMAANGIHCIDLLRFFGGDVASVYAFSSAWKDRTPDSYGALIRFKNGAIGHYVSNWTSPGRWEVTAYGFDMRVDLSPLEEGKVTTRGGSVSPLRKDDIDVKFKPGFYAQDKYFVDHVRQSAPIERPAANLEDALGTMRLVEAIAFSQGK